MLQLDQASFRNSARAAARLLRALANERRLMILCELTERESSVGDLARCVGLSASALSQHLARLKEDDLVHSRRQAQTVFYRLGNSSAARIMKTLAEIFCPPEKTKPPRRAKARLSGKRAKA